MNLKSNHSIYIAKLILLTSFLVFSSISKGTPSALLIDDFSQHDNTSLGTSRIFVSDTSVGGNSTMDFHLSEGVIQVSGDIMPPRGQPGWSSMVLLLNEAEQVVNASMYKGIKLRIQINSGAVSISANSADVSNFDYHSAQVITQIDGEFHDIKIPFTSMKRMWSEQTQLNTKALNSLSIVAFGLKQTKYEFAIEEISFY
ncbi:CIA30 family protein [Agaribacter marinus]|uniref:NADH:ubiquinone oxidoreductase intermediate-associated protein 30 domain-containing protein n=1 Tax=Agaribacter marinus TaxID=1431249 RepID=A0AA37WKK5_9ALTE|nr:CIA30 family protein [Agaribacter marinus]GLR71704.1 hypothetical protein GCM10007852_26120 [Agaribacter marinus]